MDVAITVSTLLLLAGLGMLLRHRRLSPGSQESGVSPISIPPSTVKCDSSSSHSLKFLPREVVHPEASAPDVPFGSPNAALFLMMNEALQHSPWMPPSPESVETSEDLQFGGVLTRLVVWHDHPLSAGSQEHRNPAATKVDTVRGAVSYRWVLRQYIAGPDARYHPGTITLDPPAVSRLVEDLAHAVNVYDVESALGPPSGFSRPIRTTSPYIDVHHTGEGLRLRYSLWSSSHQLFGKLLTRDQCLLGLAEMREVELHVRTSLQARYGTSQAAGPN